MHHFMRNDLLASLLAICIYPLFVLVPGYVLAWFLDLFQFRRRSAGFRLALSVPLSISVCPILIYLAGRFGSMASVWGIFVATAIAFGYLVLRRGPGVIRVPAGSAAIVVCWLAISLLVSVDLQLGTRDYYPVTAFDYAVRTGFIHSISTGGVPPANPFFFPGHEVPLKYHYFWLLFCSLVDQSGFDAVNARQAWIGGIFWSGLGLMAVVALFLRLFWTSSVASFERRTRVGILLLGVTGLDILPTFVLWLMRAGGMPHAVLPSMEWWNEQVDGFTYTALFEAHHICGLIACLMAYLLIHEGSRLSSGGRRIAYAACAGIAMATAVGASIHVSFAFGVYLVVWFAMAIVRKWRRLAVSLAVAGALALLLVAPYGLGLRPGPGGGAGVTSTATAYGGPPVVFWVRPFRPVSVLFSESAAPVRFAINALFLPLNYFLELGFFFAAAVAWWRRRRKKGHPLSREELAIAVLAATSLAIGTFFRSSLINNNDLGWRGLLFAQFAFLLWAVDVIVEMPRRRLMAVLLAVGAIGTAYDVSVLRFYPVLADAGVVMPPGWMAPDRQLGSRNAAAREAYEWIRRNTRPDARVQFNPNVALQDTSALLYLERRNIAADTNCMAVFGGNPSLCPAQIAELNKIYTPEGHEQSLLLDITCRKLPVDMFVVKDTDLPWKDRRSWVWTQPPAFANAYFRVFACGTERSHAPQ